MHIIQVLALKGTLSVLEALKKNGPMRYKDLVKAVGYSTTTSRCLKAMEQTRMVSKRALTEPYRPVEYRLTEKGERAFALAQELDRLGHEG